MNKQLKRIFKIAFIVASIASLYFVPWVLVRAWILPLPDTVQDQVDDAVDLGFDGMIVYVDESGKPPAFFTAGWHDRKIKIPATPTALFKIASISKLYKAVAITKLVSDNRLSLDKTLADYFPELVGRIEYADKITLRSMVQHRSGIPNYTNTPGYWEHPARDRKEALALVLDSPADFYPGADYEYSNTNYLLISELIEKTVGHSYSQYIKERILTPLGLKHTFGSLSEVNIDSVMSGYYVGIETDLKNQDYGMVATAEDVGKFLRALNDGSLLDDREQEIYSSIYVYDHTGWVPGYQSIAKYYQDIDAVVIAFVNTTGGYNWNTMEIVYNRIVEILRKSHRNNS